MKAFISYACAISTAFVLATLPAQAQKAPENALPVDGNIAPNGRAVELRWFDADPPRVGAVIINRRQLGETGAQSWRALGPAQGPVMSATDTTTRPGIAYEYQVMRTARDIVDVGYWTTGVEIPAVDTRGTAYVVIDRTIAEPLSARLDRLQRDLTGDGWRVRRLLAPRGTPSDLRQNIENAVAVRNWLRQQYEKDPFGHHTVILIGHVPLPLSGRAAPDGHEPRAHPTDLIYADMDGRWQANPEGLLFDNQVPGDSIEMQIGRVDFSQVSGKDPAREITLLRDYFDRNHHWRMGLHGDLREAYAQNGNLTVERHSLRNIVGPEALASGGHHDIGETGPWLWGVDFGDARGHVYAEEFANEAIFTLNFGSNKQTFNIGFNGMTAMLAQPWYTLAVGWGGRPAWRLHHMALGGTIGEVHQRTVNNGKAALPYRESMDYYPTGIYMWRNPIWVNLLGDPTTRAFMLAPPASVALAQTDGGIQVSWQASPDPDTRGYRIYRAASGDDRFTPLNAGEPLSGLSFTDTEGTDSARYMVRAYGLKDVYAGSFFTLSQGAFSTTSSDLQDSFAIATGVNLPVALPAVFNAPQDGVIYALIEGPEVGRLTRSDTGLDYTPPAGFTGDVRLRFSASHAWVTQTGVLTVTVTGD